MKNTRNSKFKNMLSAMDISKMLSMIVVLLSCACAQTLLTSPNSGTNTTQVQPSSPLPWITSPQPSSTLTTVRLGLLAPITDAERGSGEGKLYAGAFYVAVDDLNAEARNRSLPVTFNSDVFRDTQNRETVGMNRMADLYCTNKVDAFIGPAVFCGVAGLMATAYNKPYMAFNCHDPFSSDDASKRNMMVTIDTLIAYVSKSVVALMGHFGWTSCWVVAGTDVKWDTTAKAFKKSAATHGITINGEDFEEANNMFIPHYEGYGREYEDVIERTRLHTRVYVFIGQHEALLHFLRKMYTRGLTQTGKYVVIAVDDDDSLDEGKEDAYLTFDEVKDTKITKAQKQEYMAALKNVLLVLPKKVTLNENGFLKRVYDRNVQPPINQKRVPIRYAKNIPFSPISYQLYDSTMIYGRAVMDLFPINGSLPVGNATIRHIRNSTHPSITGNDIFVHVNGQTEGSYRVLSMAYTSDRQDVKLHEVASLTLENEIKLSDHHHVTWLHGLPLSNPVCGFDDKCPVEKKVEDWVVGIIGLVGVLVLVILVVGVLFYVRHYRYEKKLERLAWKIERAEISMLNTGEYHEMNTPSGGRKKESSISTNFRTWFRRDSDSEMTSELSETSDGGHAGSQYRRLPVGSFKGETVVVKQMPTHIDATTTTSVK